MKAICLAQVYWAQLSVNFWLCMHQATYQTSYCINWVTQWKMLNAKHILPHWQRFKVKKTPCTASSIIRCNVVFAWFLSFSVYTSATLSFWHWSWVLVTVSSTLCSIPMFLHSSSSAQMSGLVLLAGPLICLFQTCYALLDFLWHVYFLPEHVSHSNSTAGVKVTLRNGKLLMLSDIDPNY